MTSIMIGAGALLVLAGILGGGFEVQKIQVPKLGGMARVISTVVGLLFVTIAIGLEKDPIVPMPAPPKLATFTIRDQLGQGEISEQVRIILDGKEVGTLSVDTMYPSSNINVTVPSDGKYSYVLEANAVFEVNGKTKQYLGAGQGIVDVSEGKIFELRGDISGETWLAHLEELRK